MDEKTLDRMFELIHSEAETRKRNAGMDGAYHDGGSNMLLMKVKFYQEGRHGLVPDEWLKYYNQAKNEQDDEWETYLRLRKKFEDQ